MKSKTRVLIGVVLLLGMFLLACGQSDVVLIPTPTKTSTLRPIRTPTLTRVPRSSPTSTSTSVPTRTPTSITAGPTATSQLEPTATLQVGPPPGADILTGFPGVWKCPLELTGAAFVGSIESDKYHYPSCRFVSKIKSENRICFASKDAAKAFGYVPCGSCKPPY